MMDKELADARWDRDRRQGRLWAGRELDRAVSRDYFRKVKPEW